LLPVPTEQKGMFEVTAQATNAAGLTAADKVTIELVDPAGKGDKKGATIEGDVTDNGRPQPGVPVTLRGADRGDAKDTATTDAKGHYKFTNVAAGSYRVDALKTGAATRGQAAVQVMDGQEKTKVDIKLTR